MARTRWPTGPVNPDLFYRTGRSERLHRWMPGYPWVPVDKSINQQPTDLNRFASQTETQDSRPYAPTNTPAGIAVRSTPSFSMPNTAWFAIPAVG